MKKIIRLSTLVLFCSVPFLTIAQTTQIRDNAGLQGNAGATSGFFDTDSPVNYPAGAASWWHLLDVRHRGVDNNFAMQFAGSFFNQELYFRKTNNSANQPWSKVLLETNGNVGIGTNVPNSTLTIRSASTGVSINPGASPYYGTLAFNRESGTGAIFDPSGQAFQINNGGGDRNLHIQVYNGDGSIVTNNSLVISGTTGNVGIGTASLSERLSVEGKIRAREIKVEATNWPDYVFEEGYKVETLKGLESYIKANKHLPGMPTAKEVENNGIAVGEMLKLQQQKIEELTLHLIEKDKQLLNEKETNKKQQDQLITFEERLKKLEALNIHKN